MPTSLKPILKSYLAGQRTLEAAATECIRILNEWPGAPDAAQERAADSPQHDAIEELLPIPELTEAERAKAGALMERVETQLGQIGVRARAYLELVGAAPVKGRPPEADVLYGGNGLNRNMLMLATSLAGIAAAVTVIALLLYFSKGATIGKSSSGGVAITNANGAVLGVLAGCWAFWVVAPPLWFAIEYIYLFKGAKAPGSFAALSYGQQVATKAWAAVVVVLGAVLFASFKS